MINKKVKNFLKLFIPPIFLDFFRFSKKKFSKIIFSSSPESQSLDVYYEAKMANILETWGERNAWIEIQHLLLNKKGKILDIACGTGKVIEVLSKINIKNVYGCDISDFLIQKAIDRGIEKDKLKVCDATNLPYEDNFFDYCYSIGSLEHFTEEQIQKFWISSNTNVKIK